MKLPRFLMDRLIRRKLALEHTPLHRFRVRLARTVDDYEGAFRLVQATYVAIGIENVLSSTLRITPQHVLPEAYVLLVEERGQLVGTMSLTLDSPAGFPLDQDYPEQLNALRAQGARLCEVGSLAVVQRCRHAGVTNLLNLAGYLVVTQKLKASHVVMGVNPKATEHYRAMYDFHPLGGAKDHAALTAPVAGLVNDLSTFEDFMRRSYPKPLQTGALAADHCFGLPLPCVDFPEGGHEELTRWKLSREVFQELFLRRSDRLATLDERTQEYLQQMRSPRTVGSGYRFDSARLRVVQQGK